MEPNNFSASSHPASTSPARVAHVLGQLAHGGVEAVVFGYYRHMNRQRFQFDFFIFQDSPQTVPEALLSLGCRVFSVPSLRNPLSHMLVMYRLLRENGYPILHVHLNARSIFSLLPAFLAGVPVRILHNHSTAAAKGETLRTFLKILLRPISKAFATHYAACSHLAAAWMFGQDTLHRGQVHIFRNAIDLSQFAYRPDVRLSVRQRLNLNDKLVIGHVGRFMPQKNHMFLLDIFAVLQALRSNAVLLLVGDGPLMAEVRHKALRLGVENKVIFVGGVSSAAAFYQAMDVFLLPSLYEGLPLVGVEAQAAGLPVFVSHAVTAELALTPLLQRIPKDASPQDWAEAVLTLPHPYPRADHTAALSDAGFSLERAAIDLSAFYRDLLS